ncbi:MAG: hypothetical protein ACRDQF_21025, partial [Thermocrispum sp.]
MHNTSNDQVLQPPVEPKRGFARRTSLSILVGAERSTRANAGPRQPRPPLLRNFGSTVTFETRPKGLGYARVNS